MPSIQELISAFYQSAQTDAPDEQAAALTKAVIEQEELLVAWFPGTKHYFMTKEFGQLCAVLFSEQDIFERFAQACHERGIAVAAVRNPVSERLRLFEDLWRCGFTRLMLDYEPLHLNLPLRGFVIPPDYSALPLHERPVLSPRMTGKILYLLQEIHTGKADGNLEMDMLIELYQTDFLIPTLQQPDGTTQIPFRTAPDGRKLAMFFSDMTEWAKVFQGTEIRPAIARFPDMKRLLEQGCDAIIINPQSGADLMLDDQLLAAAEQAAMGDTSDLKLHTLRDGEHVTVSEPDRIPAQMTERITACLQNYQEIKTAWLRMIRKDSSLMPGFLLILEGVQNEDTVYKAIAEVVLPVAEGRSLECISYDKGLAQEWVGSAKPFYRKKRFGFMK